MTTTPIEIRLTEKEREELEFRARGLRTPHRDVIRGKIILRVADGQPLAAVAREIGRQRKIVRKWAQRFVTRRLQGLVDKAGRGRVPVFSPGGGHDAREARVRAA